MEPAIITSDRPFGVDEPYKGPHIGRTKIELSEQGTPPQDGNAPVCNFKR
jgi:hypothetical protein